MVSWKEKKKNTRDNVTIPCADFHVGGGACLFFYKDSEKYKDFLHGSKEVYKTLVKNTWGSTSDTYY